MVKPVSRTQWCCLSLGALLLTHCSDGGNATSPEGSAGTAPTAGTTSTAGTAAAQAGQAGAVATAGSPPAAGTSNGGAGAGTAGTAPGGSGNQAAGSAGAAAGSGGVGGSLGAGGTGGGAGGGAFKLTSSEHVEGAVFADALTCAGVGRSPSLAWTAGPAGTKSYAITFLDETLVAQNNANGYHWVIWDIPAATLALPQNLPAGASLTSPVTAKQFSPANGFDKLPANAYFGPCPNAIGNTTNTDTYAFTIYALSVEQLTGTLNGVKNIEAAIKATTPLATTALHGTSMAKPN
jgi:Raf kinase inhibitor-like YbhB/YbcL family protein